ncbi:EAL domain-containing protein [bacterium]|nr:EAL domain-containing protein [bacterium]
MSFFKKISIKKKLTLLIVFSLISITFITSYLYFSTQSFSKEKGKEHIKLSLNILKNEINNFFIKYLDLTKSIAFLVSIIENGNEDNLFSILERVQTKHKSNLLTTYVGFENKDYNRDKFLAMPAYETVNGEVKKVIVDGDYNHKDRIWYKMAKEAKDTIVTPPYIDATTNKLCITFATPIYKNEDKSDFIGVAAIDLSLETIQFFLKEFEQNHVKERGSIILLSEEKDILYHTSSKYIYKKIDDYCNFNMRSFEITCNNKEFFAQSTDILNNSFILELMLNKKQITSHFDDMFFRMSLFALLFIVIIAFFYQYLSRYIIHSIFKIQEALFSFFRFIENNSEKIQEIKIELGDEFGEMGKSINEAILELKQRINKDNKLIQETIHIVEKIKQGVYDQTQIEIDAGNFQLNLLKEHFNTMTLQLYSKIKEKTKELEDLNSDLEDKIKIKTEELHQQLLRSPLTGYYNISKLQSELSSIKHRDKLLFFLDISDFNQFNHAYGILVGDHIIRQAGVLIRDILPENGEIYHFNGDRFVVLIKNPKENQCEDFLGKVLDIPHQKSIFYNDVEIKLSFHIGIVQNEQSNLIQKGIIALSKAKKKRVPLFNYYQSNEEHEQKYKDNIYWSKKVSTSLEKKLIIPYFQGIYNNKTGKIEKYEALARMIDSDNEGTIISPAIFIKHIQQIGLMTELTKIMIKNTILFFKQGAAQISVNITTTDLEDQEFLPFIKALFDEENIELNRLILEVLEDGSISENPFMLNQLNELRKLGCKIAIDDFGSGYSNFSRLLDLQVDFIKIDGSFIKEIDTNEKNYKIVKSIVSFAKTMDAEVVAEFVHSQSVFDKVKELGIEYSQGFFLHKPEPKI